MDPLAALPFAATVLAVAFQFADVGTAWYDSRRAGSGRVRLNPGAWVVPVVAAALVVAVIACDAAARSFHDGDVVGAVVVASATAAGLAGIWLVAVRGVFRRTPQAYVRMRSELRRIGEARVPRERLDQLRERLAAADRARPSAKVTVRRLLLGQPWRFAPVVVALVSLILAGVAGQRGFVLAAVVLLAASVALLVVGARIAVTARLAWRRVADEERGKVVRLLEAAEARSAKRNPGLGDRVNRALQILREQQH